MRWACISIGPMTIASGARTTLVPPPFPLCRFRDHYGNRLVLDDSTDAVHFVVESVVLPPEGLSVTVRNVGAEARVFNAVFLLAVE